jgi:hypothetical protein
MLPGILPLHPEIAAGSIAKYRMRTLAAAVANAASQKYDG